MKKEFNKNSLFLLFRDKRVFMYDDDDDDEVEKMKPLNVLDSS